MALQSPDASNDLDAARVSAKVALREALSAHGGDPTHAAVAEAIAHLVALNPTAAPTHASALLEGHWALISAPSFPNGERRADGTYCYTLGRLAFNMFQPRNLKVVIDQVSQPVLPLGKGELRSHDIVVHFTTLDERLPPLRGIVCTFGLCQPQGDAVIEVQFSGGALDPAPGEDLHRWIEYFGRATSATRPSLMEWLQGQILQLMFGLVPPTKIDENTGHTEFKMKRSPKGEVAILYLDEELRITRGNKETVLVCERLAAEMRP